MMSWDKQFDKDFKKVKIMAFFSTIISLAFIGFILYMFWMVVQWVIAK